MSRLRSRDLIHMAARASMLQATWNYERQQGLGWAWALEPALVRLYDDPAERSSRLAEHTAYFNTQPTLASLALGAVASIEERRASGESLDGDALGRVKNVLGSSLAAIGDRLFWFSLRPFAACLGVMVALGGASHWAGAVLLLLSYNLVHQSIRVMGVRWGYERGPAVLDARLRARLQGLSRALCGLGAGLIGVLVAMALVPGGQPRPMLFQALLAFGLALGLIGAQRARPSPTEWAIAIGLGAIAAAWA